MLLKWLDTGGHNCTPSNNEFIRRFLLHVLPEGMHRIRYFGILANGCRATTLKCARVALGTVGCAASGETAGGPEGDHEHDRDRGTDTATAPVLCWHCGGVLRLVREIPRHEKPLSARVPPQAHRHPAVQHYEPAARLEPGQRGPQSRRTGQLVLADGR